MLSRLLSKPAFEWNVLTLTVNAQRGVSSAAWRKHSPPPPAQKKKISVFMTGRRWAGDGQGCCSVLSTDCY